MKSIKQDIRSGIIIFLTIITLSIITVFATNWYDSMTAVVGDGLTATKWNLVAKATVPSGFIGAFNLSTCPAEWTPADGQNSTPDLRGQFLRGMNTFDNGVTTRSDGNQDPAGSRSLRNYQADAFQGHFHNIYNSFAGIESSSLNLLGYKQGASGVNFVNGTDWRGGSTEIRGSRTDGTNGTPRTANETRPKNVAVIFCIKL